MLFELLKKGRPPAQELITADLSDTETVGRDTLLQHRSTQTCEASSEHDCEYDQHTNTNGGAKLKVESLTPSAPRA